MNEYHAAICEDHPKSLRFIEAQLSNAFQEKDFSISFDCFSDAKSLLDQYPTSKQYDLLFLDIDMPEMNGIELCRRIRKENPTVTVVFISNKEEMVFQTFEVNPFRFIRKSHFSEELPPLVTDLIRDFNDKKGTKITITEAHSNTIYNFDTNRIIYIEVISRSCRIVTPNNETCIQYPIKDFEKLLKEYGFIRPHRSYLVNYRYIFSIQKSCMVLDNGDRIPLSRNRIIHAKEQFLTLTHGGTTC